MPFALAIIGITIFVTAIRGTTSTLFGLIKDDFTGNGNFIYWVLSILVIGSVGYVKRLQPVANIFLALVMIVLLIGAGNKGFFAQFMAAIKTPATNCGGSDSITTTTAQALDAAKSAPGAGFGTTLQPLAPGQIIPDPVAIGPM